MRELEDLKYGDKITISYSYDLYTAKVLDNFPDDEKILLKMRVGWFMSITRMKMLQLVVLIHHVIF